MCVSIRCRDIYKEWAGLNHYWADISQIYKERRQSAAQCQCALCQHMSNVHVRTKRQGKDDFSRFRYTTPEQSWFCLDPQVYCLHGESMRNSCLFILGCKVNQKWAWQGKINISSKRCTSWPQLAAHKHIAASGKNKCGKDKIKHETHLYVALPSNFSSLTNLTVHLVSQN